MQNERQIRELREKRENDQREIMQKMAEIQRLSSKVEVWRERVQEEFNSKECIQDKICGEVGSPMRTMRSQ
ncbi:unnamed protein product [Dibothriocephalus latus]|uniref:Uncharacterized protein n=1 Tax=Dibothriocephalus latus TaxID=60516 RepID=A0A3P7NRK6_DIBLA|nr:unnamed protein product [Dibothriocephalus latus]